ncbi:hypothetical protein D3C87_1935450 [compost metagenome]
MPRPKKRASNQARELAKKNGVLEDFRPCDVSARWVHQNSNAKTASSAQIASPTRQLPVLAITSGANDAAMAAPPMIDVT